jgi:hypothetical protein
MFPAYATQHPPERYMTTADFQYGPQIRQQRFIACPAAALIGASDAAGGGDRHNLIMLSTPASLRYLRCKISHHNKDA